MRNQHPKKKRKITHIHETAKKKVRRGKRKEKQPNKL
jgi:hypothetical protein